MRFDLKAPCSNCPFRNDRGPFGLDVKTVREILGGGEGRDYFPAPSFACHKTVDYDRRASGRGPSPDEQHCAGVAIILHRERRLNDALQLASRLGLWDPAQLDMLAPVYNSTAEALQLIPGSWSVQTNCAQ